MENRLDQYFRENLRDREFEFENAWWQEAEKLLVAERRRKRRKLLGWWGGTAAALALVVAAAGWWFQGEKNGAIIGEKSNQNSPMAAQEKDAVPDGLFQKIQTPVTESPAENPSPTGQVGQPIFNPEKPEASRTRQPKQPGLTASGQLNKAPSALGETTTPAPEKPNVPAISAAAEPVASLPAQEKITGSDEAEGTAAPIVPVVEASSRAEDLVPLPVIWAFVVGDFSKNINTATATEILTGKPRFRAGFTAAQLMRAGPANGGQAILGHRAGLVFQFEFSKKWHVSTGLQYHRRTGTFEVSKAAENRRYRFGLERDTALLKPSGLHYVSVPVLVGRRQGRHVAEAGLVFDYLAGVRGARGTFAKTADLPPRREFRAQQEGWLAEDGYKKWTATAQLGYCYRVNRHLSFGASANFTLGGILEKNYKSPTGDFLLKEADKFYITVQAVYLIK